MSCWIIKSIIRHHASTKVFFLSFFHTRAGLRKNHQLYRWMVSISYVTKIFLFSGLILMTSLLVFCCFVVLLFCCLKRFPVEYFCHQTWMMWKRFNRLWCCFGVEMLEGVETNFWLVCLHQDQLSSINIYSHEGVCKWDYFFINNSKDVTGKIFCYEFVKFALQLTIASYRIFFL